MAEHKEIPSDIKDDIKLVFDLYKNEYNKISKLKLRTMLFSFIMYKANASEINEYINSRLSDEKEFYSFDDVCDLITEKYDESRENDAYELYDYIANKRDNNTITKKQISEAFKSTKIKFDEKDIDKMIEFIKKKKKNSVDEEEPKNEDEEKNLNENKIYHKNLKPSNILVDDEGKIKLSDCLIDSLILGNAKRIYKNLLKN